MEASQAALPVAGVKQVVSDYVTLTKPKVQLLLLLTTITTMYVAGDPSLALVAITVVGGFLTPAGPAPSTTSTTATSTRRWAGPPAARCPSGRISPRAALLYAFALQIASFVILAIAANLLSAFLALAGFVWYTLVYTVWLKRRSPQNIVIGGAAGAIPPLVGWAAVTGSVAPAALYLFAIVFYWTPPHFWALSLLMKDEYARVGVPMMPVVHGEVETRRQIVLYTFLLTVLTLLPFVFGFFGVIYAVFAVGLAAAFITLSLRLQRRADRKSALRTYLFSLGYLAVLFVAMVLDAQL